MVVGGGGRQHSHWQEIEMPLYRDRFDCGVSILGARLSDFCCKAVRHMRAKSHNAGSSRQEDSQASNNLDWNVSP